jgi:acetyltransferase-like isoleucine patch superfamily enzyme
MKRSVFMRRIFKGIAGIFTPTELHQSGWERKTYWLRLAGIDIAKEGVAISSGFQCLDGNEENIRIERHVAIGHNFHLWNFGNINIGRFSMIAAGVTVSNGWHDKTTFIPSSGPVSIGAGCWIGVNASIVGSVSIGENAIVAAGALVNKDVPPNSIAAGVPAKVIGMRELPARVWHFGNVYFCPHTFEIIEEHR